MWGTDAWGTLVWGGVQPVPLLGPGGGVLLVISLLLAAFVIQRRRRRWGLATLGAASIVVLPLAAWATGVTLPFVFSNGTVADAVQVNANFDALNGGIDALDTGFVAHQANSAAHHAKTTDAGELVTGTLDTARLPATVSLLGTDISAAELSFDTATQAELNAHAAFAAGEYVNKDGDTMFGTLNVEDNVTINGDFQYDSPRNRTLGITGAVFVTSNDDNDALIARSSSGYAYITSGVPTITAMLLADVQLPAGAFINTLVCMYYDTNAGADLGGSVFLRSRAPTATVGTILGSVILGSPGIDDDTVHQVSTAIGATVSSSNSYYLAGTLTPGTTGSTIRFYGCQIQYTVNGVL